MRPDQKKNKESVGSLKSSNDMLRQQIAGLMMQYNSLLVDYNTLMAQHQELSSQDQQLSEDFNQLKQVTGELEEYKTDLEAKHSELWQENERLEAENADLWQENEQLKAQTQTSSLMSPFYPFSPFPSSTAWYQESKSALPTPSPTLLKIKKTEPDTFEHQVLQLLTEDLKKEADLKPLKTHLEESEESGEYFEQFIPYIKEEIRAQVKQQLEMIGRKNLRPFAASLQVRSSDEKGEEHNSTITVRCDTTELPKLDHGFYLEAVFIVIKEENKGFSRKNWREENVNGLAAIASVTKQENKKNQKKAELLLKIRKVDYQNYRNVLEKNREIQIHWLCGLIPSSRMYDVCVRMPKVSFESQFIRGSLEPWPVSTLDESLLGDEKSYRLNPSQRNAVQKLQEVESGIYFLQGPPGTGKTITVQDFLIQRAKIKPKERILACAPSNQAVRVMLKGIQEQQPKMLMALVGIGKDIPEEMADVYVHNYTYRLSNPLIALKRRLENFLSLDALKELMAEIIERYAAIKDELMTLLETPTPMTIKSDIIQAMKRLITQLDATSISQASASSQTSVTLTETKDSLPSQPPIIFVRGEEQKIKQQLIEQLEEIITILNQNAHYLESFLVQRAQIVFSTLISSGRKWLKKQIAHFPAVIVDEAAQALVPEALIPLDFHPKLYIHVGDPSQLPATVISKAAQEGGYGNSLMSWLMIDCHQPFERLKIQYRMNPQICQWPSEQFYEGELETAPIVLKRKCALNENPKLAPLFKHPSLFFNIEGKEERHGLSHSASIYNDNEAIAVVKTLSYLLGCGFKASQIGIITFYAAQVSRIQFHRQKMITGGDDKMSSVDVRTVDGFQGGERDIILVSVVRTVKSVGFLNDRRRINVAMTRAKYGRFVFGSKATLSDSNSEVQNFLSSSSIKKIEDESQLTKVIGKLSYR